MALLKEEPGPDLVIFGSGELIGSLRRGNLIDEYLLLIHPVILGSGRRLLPDGAAAALRLTESVPTTTGVIMARYELA